MSSSAGAVWIGALQTAAEVATERKTSGRSVDVASKASGEKIHTARKRDRR